MFNVKARGLRSSALGIMQICICMIFLSAVPTEAFSQFKKSRTSGSGQLTESPGMSGNGNISIENARVMLLTDNIRGAAIVYSELLANDSLNVSLNSEYAYSLALNGIYDAALSRLDRIWRTRGTNTDPLYFASQIFLLMEYNQLAADILSGQAGIKAPVWIASKTADLNKKYIRNAGYNTAMNGDQTVENFSLANRLTARGSYMQATAIFEEIIKWYPGEYLPYVGLSISLEKAGVYNRAAWAVESALKIVGNDPAKAEARQSLEKRFASVRSKVTGTTARTSPALQPGLTPITKSTSMMLYAGGMISSAYTSVNTRVGYFTSDNGNAAVDLGVSSFSGNTAFNLGLSYFQRHKIMVAGFGLTGNIGKDTKAIYLKISTGLSFVSKRNKASWDIFLDGQAPFNRELATTIGMSFGRSLYFGTRK